MEKECRLEEYKYLNQQIMNHQRLIIQVFTFSVIASVALLGYALQSVLKSDDSVSTLMPYIVLAPSAIIVPCAFLITSVRREIQKWGAYIMVFHENKDGAYWETRLRKFAEINRTAPEPFSYLFVTYAILQFVIMIAYIWSVAHTSMNLSWMLLALLPFTFLSISASQYGEINTKKASKLYIGEWEKVKQSFEDTTSSNDKLIPN